MGVFNQWTHLYLKLRSNCRCNCSLPMLTRVKIQTQTHCEWPEVPRYPLHQQACSTVPLGIPWRGRFHSAKQAANPIWKRVCWAPSHLFYRKFKSDHLTFSGYNLLLSTLWTWYFISAERSRRKKKKKRRAEEGASCSPGQPACTVPCPRAATWSGKPSRGVASDPLTSVSRVNPEMKHSGSLSVNFSFTSSWQLIFSKCFVSGNVYIFFCTVCGFTTTGSDSCWFC